jgi:hypothetical protein
MSRSLRSLLFMPGSSSEDRQGGSISHTGMGAREILIEVGRNSQEFSEGRVIRVGRELLSYSLATSDFEDRSRSIVQTFKVQRQTSQS